MRRACLGQTRRLHSSCARDYSTSLRTAQSDPSPFAPKPHSKQRYMSSSHAKSRTNATESKSTKNASYLSYPLTELKPIVRDPASKHQIYVSFHRNAHFNLSIEHYLLQNSPPDSRILFLYVNNPTVVIGLNHNPWLEANLWPMYKRHDPGHNDAAPPQARNWPGMVGLIRRR